MITTFGKALRRIRLDNGELLKDMADKLGVTSSYLSAVEHGKKQVTNKLLRKIIKAYELIEAEKDGLMRAFEESIHEVNIALANYNSEKRELGLSFARNFENLESHKIQQLMDILEDRSE